MNKLIKSTILVLDIPGFTKIASTKSPIEITKYLNDYYKKVGNIVNKNKGKIIKYIGDSILIVFNKKNSEKNAINSSINIINELNYKNCISISNGIINYSKIGYYKLKMNDIFGEPINIAYRQLNIFSKNKIENNNILVTEEVKNRVDDIKMLLVDEWDVKGLNKKIKSYKIES